jgi:dTDP-4-amino-4,6-dideoxygalactose transaminase
MPLTRFTPGSDDVRERRALRVSGMTATYRIPFNRPTRTFNDAEYIQRALALGHLSGDGPFTMRCHEMLQQVVGVPKALLTTSCTHALEMAAFLLDVKPGDEVIVPSFTFVSSVNAFVIRGARPVFADIRPDTLCIDERHVARLLTPRTRAIVAVHYAGVACEMDVLTAMAGASGATVVEDNAHGLFGSSRGRNLGTMGSLATLSFHETKNVTCGEGGALLINDRALIARAEIIREKGTDRSRFFRGEVDKYGWIDVGSSYLPSELLAAMLCAQLEDRERVQERRRSIWSRYASQLARWARDRQVVMPTVPSSSVPSHHMFHILLPSSGQRDRLVAHLKARSILAVSHYLPLNASSVGQTFGGRQGDCPVAERVATELLRLPFYTDLSADDQQDVIDALLEFD